MKRPYFRLADWRRNTLLLTAAASLGLTTLPACSGNESGTDAGGDWSTSAEDAPARSFSQGVITELTETQPGQWKITAERPAGQEEVAAILRHFDGKVDTLQGQALQQQMQQYSRQHTENRIGGTGMMDALMWSGIGFMAGRFLTPQPGFYANPGLLNQNQAWRANVARERDDERRSFHARGFSSAGAGLGRSGVLASRSVRRASPAFRSSSAPRFGRSSGFGSRGGFRGFGG